MSRNTEGATAPGNAAGFVMIPRHLAQQMIAVLMLADTNANCQPPIICPKPEEPDHPAPILPPPMAQPFPENELIWALDRLEHFGFERKGLVWCRRTSETLFSFELRRAKTDVRYRMVVGMTFLHLHRKPPRHSSALRCDLHRNFELGFITPALDFSQPFQDDRAKKLACLIYRFVLPAADACLTAKEALSFHRSRAPFGTFGALPLRRRFLRRLKRARNAGKLPENLWEARS